MAVYVAAAGANADDAFCEGVMNVLGPLTTVFNAGVFFPLVGLCFWQLLTDATSPYPLIGGIALFFAFYFAFMSLFFDFALDNLPLEIYHMPAWLQSDLRMSMPWLRSRLNTKALRAPAERRAAKLRAQMGL